MNYGELISNEPAKEAVASSEPQEMCNQLNEHCCTVQPTMNLRWKVGLFYQMLIDDRKLEQAFVCRECGKSEWREVPEVKEEVK